MDKNITVYLAGYMTVYQDDLILRKFGKATEDIDPMSLSRDALIRAINKGEIHIMVSSIIQEEKFDEINFNVTEVE